MRGRMEVRITEYCDTSRYFANIKLRVICKDIIRAHTDHQWRLRDLLNGVQY